MPTFKTPITCRCISQVKVQELRMDKGYHEVKFKEADQAWDMTFDLSHYPHIDREAVEEYDKQAKRNGNWQESTRDLPLATWTKGKDMMMYRFDPGESISLVCIYLTPMAKSITVEFRPAGAGASRQYKKKMHGLGFRDIEQADPRHVCTHYPGCSWVHDHWFRKDGNRLNDKDIGNVIKMLKGLKAFGADKSQLSRYGRDAEYKNDFGTLPKDMKTWSKPETVASDLIKYFNLKLL